MKSKLVWGASLATMALVLSACGGSTDSTDVAVEAPAPEVTVEEVPADDAAAVGVDVVFDSLETQIPVGFDQPEAGSFALA